MHSFGSSGVRGVANEELRPRDVLAIAQAAGAVLAGDRAALARDTRTTGELLADAAASGLASVGLDVDRLGQVATPGLQHYCDTEGVPGVMITASHNPPPFNGVKLIGSDGVELDRDTLDRIEAHLAAALAVDGAANSDAAGEEGAPARADWDRVGRVRRIEGAADDYVDAVLAAVERDAIAAADLTVVVDPGHGAGTHSSPRFFRELGCRVHTVNAQPDGTFPGRDPEPVAEHLGDLREHVRGTDADLGIAHDGDADRAIFVDETGSHVDGDAALAALVADAAGEGDTVVSAVNASQRLHDVAAEVGAAVELTPIGSTNIITRVRELRAAGERVVLAGEGNGGVIYPDYRLARDGLYTAARFCQLVADRPASEVIAPYDGYANVRASVPYGTEAEREAMLAAIEDVATDAEAAMDTTDGYRLSYGDGWVLARPSGTEPVVRVYAEARDRERAEELLAVFEEPVRAAITE